ncbi:MAG TPA: carboxypeptidase-like regulatory domain-containing protein, partial [Planctomycetota bacterium]|nr:carboxypeptidase-like regulatory domain-containing protein [Planctomycetota bacterium]
MRQIPTVLRCASIGLALGPFALAQTTIVRPHYAWRDHAISGTVVRSDGSPVVGANVVLRATEHNGSIELGRTTSNADGRFSIATEA